MLMNVIPAKFNQKPITFISILDKRYPCHFPSNYLYDEKDVRFECMFCSVHINNLSGKFSGFKVRRPEPEDIRIEFEPFTQEGKIILAKTIINDEEFNISPGLFRDYIVKEPSDKPKRCLGWVRQNPNSNMLRLEGIGFVQDLNLEKLLAESTG
jgi:hypothetical protein